MTEGKGLLPQPPDKRDYNYAFIAAAAAPVNWSSEFRLPEPPDHNQGTSDSCVAHSTSYFHWQLKRKDYSRRDLFSRIALDYGAYLRDGVKTVCEVGQQTKDECPDPLRQTMQNMRVKATDPTLGLDDLEARYFSGGASIDQIAQAVRDFGGAVFGVLGNDAGWVDKTNPRPPVTGEEAEWGHAIYAMGYHMHDGMKCIIAKSSWCNSTHHEHHIKENYFSAGRVFDNWILVPKETLMAVNRYLVNKNGKLGVLVSVDGDGVFADTTFWAKSEAHLEALKDFYEIPDDAKVINYPA